MTCWAPVCASISICDYTQIQGGRHSAVLRRPPVLADWGSFICQPAEIERSLPPVTGTRVAPSSAAPQGGQERDLIVRSAEPKPAPAGGHVCISLCTRVLVHLSNAVEHGEV